MAEGKDYNGDGEITEKERKRWAKDPNNPKNKTGSTGSLWGSDPTQNGTYIEQIEGEIVLNIPTGETERASGGAPSYVQTPKMESIKFTSSSQLKAYFTKILNENGQALRDFMKMSGAKNTNDARALWNDMVDYAYDLAQNGESVDFYGLLYNKQFAKTLSGYSSGGGGASGPTTMTYTNLTAESTAKANLQRDMKAILGREATPKELADYVKKLHAQQRKFSTTSVQGSTYRVDTSASFDEEAFTLEYILNLTGKKFAGGQLKSTLDGVKALAASYGLDRVNTDLKFKQMTKDLLLGNETNETLATKFSETAASLFPAWSQYLKANPTKSLYEIASDYVNLYANMLEVDIDTVKLTDVLGMSSVNGQVASLSEMEKMLRKDARFQFTKAARSEAAAFGASFARSMGVNI